jgi:hypothetical protein
MCCDESITHYGDHSVCTKLENGVTTQHSIITCQVADACNDSLLKSWASSKKPTPQLREAAEKKPWDVVRGDNKVQVMTSVIPKMANKALR